VKTLQELARTLRERRKALNLSQKDMLMRIGMSQQQYQRIEAGGDLRVSTLLRILEGIDLELLAVTKRQLRSIQENSGEYAPQLPASSDESPWGALIDSLVDTDRD